MDNIVAIAAVWHMLQVKGIYFGKLIHEWLIKTLVSFTNGASELQAGTIIFYLFSFKNNIAPCNYMGSHGYFCMKFVKYNQGLHRWAHSVH